ncbi:Type II secretion system protein D precursor [Mariniblastus fucicola]|uniref:Type II secretion system protein D n=1 Tax=Mariniblastus fucicola TaxID=980251 RepID=A0A5B9P994_9BACT|nr:Type II secretion system protein D precursor [Mariniblastus fucicola]
MANTIRHHLKTLALKCAIPVLCVSVFCTAGCQSVSPRGAATATQSRSIADIAQESLKAADFGGFETLGDPNATDSSASGRPVSTTTRIGSPRRTISRTPQPRTPVKRGPNGNALIDEIFDQTDVREALQAIASQANVSIIVDDQVAGTVTTLIQNEPLEQALQKVLLPLGHHYRVIDGQYMVCGTDPSSPMFSMIADRLDYSPVFAAPMELVELLSEKNRQFVRVAPKRNMVIVEAPTKIANQIEEELRLFDRPVPQVVLEAMVVVVSPDTGFQFGTNVGQGYTDGDDRFNFDLDGLELSGNLSGAAIKDLFSNFALTSFFVRALEQEGYLSIRATPHVMAKTGEKAEISIARESFFSTQPLALSAQTFFRQDIQKVEAGISLIITPTIRGDNVTMVIEKAEVSEDIRATVDDPAVDNPYPLINRRQVSTTVHVGDGETVVIGGLMQNQMVDRVSRVPVLGDLPLVGRFFTQIVQEEAAAEVVVFISPRIVRTGSPHPMQGTVAAAQAGNEFCYQRQFPRDNGLELGGPIAQTPQQHAQIQYQQPAVSHSQDAAQYIQLSDQPVYADPAQIPQVQQQPSAAEQVPALQQIPVQQHVPAPQHEPAPQYVPAPQPTPAAPQLYSQPVHVEPTIQMPTRSYQQSSLTGQTYHPQTLQNHINQQDASDSEQPVTQTPNLRRVGQTRTQAVDIQSESSPETRKILRARPAKTTQVYQQPPRQRQNHSGTSARIMQNSVQQSDHR